MWCAGRSAQISSAQGRFFQVVSFVSAFRPVRRLYSNPPAVCRSSCKARSAAAVVSLECRLAGNGAYLYLPKKKSSVVVKYPLCSLQLAVRALMRICYRDKPVHSSQIIEFQLFFSCSEGNRDAKCSLPEVNTISEELSPF